MFPEKTQEREKYGFQKNTVLRICSDHFVDGEPTIEHPYPTLNMGHDITIQKKRRRTVLKHDLPVKKVKISTETVVSGVIEQE